jgi:hypothetical protein
MKNYLYFIGLAVCFYSCTGKQVKFTPLTQFNHTDTVFVSGKMQFNRTVTYIINDYRDNKETLKAMDSCAKVVAKNEFKGFTYFGVIFYKSSDITNVAHLKENPRDIDRYSQENDMLFYYVWLNGKFYERKNMQDN